MRRVAWLAAVIAVLGPVAAADVAGVDDAADTGDVMDLAHAVHAHEGRDVLVHTLSTHEPWSNDDFAGGWIRLWVEHRGGKETRLLVVVERNPDASFSASVHRAGARFEPGDLVGFANAYRSGDRALTLQIARETLGKRVRRYESKAFLVYPCSRSDEVTCAPPPPDTHPGRLLHELRNAG